VRAEPLFRRLPRAVREQQMLDAAVTIFSRHGFHGASMDEIAELAGISKPMLYAYLGAKDELFSACVRREGERLVGALVSAFELTPGDVEPALDERLWQGLRAFFGFVAGHRDGWSMLYQQPRGEERFAGMLADLRERVIDLVAGLLRRAAAEADECADHEALDLLAQALVGAAEALADRLVAQPDGDPDLMATRLVSAVWLGADALLRGATWRP
jgi:AcrR family transcriptional regulator